MKTKERGLHSVASAQAQKQREVADIPAQIVAAPLNFRKSKGAADDRNARKTWT